MFLLLFSNILHAKTYSHHVEWEYKPDIIICGKQPPDIEFVNKSLKYWKDLGYEFGVIEKAIDCPIKKPGKITIENKYLPGEEGNTHVKKYAYQSDLKKEYIDYAIIKINQASTVNPNENQDTLTHEIGHALGILHTEDEEDIMFPYVY